jgi:hypothetical protein
MPKTNLGNAEKPKPKGKRSAEFIKWVWLDSDKGKGFCGGIYFQPGQNYYSSVLSDDKGLTFKTEAEAEAWLLADKRGEHAD